MQHILTGSQNLLLTESISESLAGRAAVLRLPPLSRREISGNPGRGLPWEPRSRTKQEPVRPAHLWNEFLRGSYPELSIDPSRNISLWHASYIQTYLERDVRSLRQIGNLTQFQSFLRVLAARTGQLLNLTDISRDLGIAVNTARAWLSVLEASFQVIVLRPYFANTGKRLVKTPKIYFTDTGTLCYLVGLKDPGHAASGPMAGAIFETAVLSEVMKVFLARGEDPQLFFLRTSAGSEVDLIIETGGRTLNSFLRSRKLVVRRSWPPTLKQTAYFFSTAGQLRMRVMGVAEVSSATFMRKRPSGATAYCPLEMAPPSPVPPPAMRV